jgi:hypothetical protein
MYHFEVSRTALYPLRYVQACASTYHQALYCHVPGVQDSICTVGLSVPQAQGMRSTAKEVSAVTRAPQEVCRTGHCAQPNIYELATAVDPATAAGGAAAAAAGAGGPGAAGAAAAEGKNK